MTATIILQVLKAAAEVAGIWAGAVKNDNEKRKKFTQEFVEKASREYPNYNVVIVHPRHSTWGTWIHQHYELPMTSGTCGYDAFFSRKGQGFTLANHGDGGYLNWAYIGEFSRNGNSVSARE